MYPSTRLALIITLLAGSPSSYAPPPPSASTSAVHKTSPLDAYPSQETVIFPDADLFDACLFKGQGRTYDICPLMNKESVVDVETEVAGEHGELKPVDRRYRIMLGTNRIVTGPGKKPVPPRAWVFLTESDKWYRPGGPGHSKTTSLTRVGPGSLVISAHHFGGPDAEFMLSLVRKTEEAGVNLAFKCTEEEEELEFSGQRDNMHHFMWRTPHACPIPAGGEFFAAENEGESGEETTEGEGELRDGDLPVGGVSRRWTGVVLLLIGFLLITASILISSPHARHYALTHLQSAGYTILPLLTNIRHLTKPVAKHFPQFRVGESRLVRWAQEDMALAGDEDFMVNSGSETGHDWNNLEAMDEYIPLKASPTRSTYKGGSYSTYGSVMLEGFDVDERDVDLGPVPEGGLKKFIRSASGTASMRIKGLFRR